MVNGSFKAYARPSNIFDVFGYIFQTVTSTTYQGDTEVSKYISSMFAVGVAQNI